ncbi:MAG TPA: filamentous hemagglutinin N-terminal domain-containing protein, partial [Methylobacter sp.]
MKKSAHIKFLVLALSGIELSSLSTTDALANPQDGQVVAGSAAITQETPNKVGITQTTDKAIIDWNSFSIKANEQTQFYQPSASSVTLNRVVGVDPSEILGRLTANGQVFLVNPNGIYFGKNAQIDVAGLVASTHNIRNEDFLAGRYNFNIPGKPGAAVINEGTINIADTGIAAFVAPSAANRGVIVAKLGKVVLAAANGFTLDFHGDELLTFLVNDEVAKTAFDLEGKQLTSFVENAGRIEAQGGYVLLTAKAAENAIHSVINQSGTIEATTVGTHNGEIILNAGKGSLSVSGTLDASAPNGGDGGFIETSGGHVAIDPATRITTAALFGKTGRWLIDPTDYTIAASGGDIIGSALANYLSASNVEIQTLATGSSGNGDIFVNDSVTWNTLNKLTLTAHRNIYVNEAINGTGGGSVKLRADSLGTGIGTVAFSGNGHITVNNGAAVGIYYNPVSYTDAATKVDKYVFPFNPFWNFVTSDNNLMTAYMLVNSVNQLQAINTNLTGNYALSRDIDASDTVNWNGGAGFVPIGSFYGTFNGLDHVISDLVINRPSMDYVGLFGVTGDTSQIQDIGLVGGSVSGSTFVGGLAGMNTGAIRNSYALGNVSGNVEIGGLVGRNNSLISNSFATGNVSGINYIGGLAGVSFAGAISNSYALGNVSGSARIGGLVGQNESSDISNSYATGNVSGTGEYIGGLVGWNNSGTVNNSYSIGSVSGTNFYSGGLVGYSSWGGTVNNSYWDTETSGKATSSAGTGLTTAQMKQQASFSGWDFSNTWQIAEGVSRPALKVAVVQPVTVLTPSGNVIPPPNSFLGLDADALYAAVINNNLANSYSTAANWLALKTGNGGNATQTQITADIMLNSYNRYRAFSGQALADKLYQDVVNHFSLGGITITNDSANLLWKGSYGGTLQAGAAQVDANIMAQSFNYYATTDKRSGYGLFADILRGSVTLPGIGQQAITNDPDNLVWRGIYGWSGGLQATEAQKIANNMKNARENYYTLSSRLLNAVNAGTISANDEDYRWVALKDGWGSSTLSLSAVQRAVLDGLSRQAASKDVIVVSPDVIKTQDYVVLSPWLHLGQLPKPKSGDSTTCTAGAFICGGGDLGNGDGVDSGNGTSTTGAGSTVPTGNIQKVTIPFSSSSDDLSNIENDIVIIVKKAAEVAEAYPEEIAREYVTKAATIVYKNLMSGRSIRQALQTMKNAMGSAITKGSILEQGIKNAHPSIFDIGGFLCDMTSANVGRIKITAP